MPTGESSQIFEDLMRFKPEGLTPNAWAMKAGVSRTVWADMRRHGNPSRRTLKKLLDVAGSSLAEFEALRISGERAADAGAVLTLAERGAAWAGAELPPLPLLATAIGGLWGDPASRIDLIQLGTGELVGRVPRPASLASDRSAYAITVLSDSMWPRFRPGRCLAVSAIAPIAVGDDVLVKLNGTKADQAAGAAVSVLLKQLVRRTGSGLELRQFNPDVTFEVPSADVAGVEKVLGELI